MRRIVVLAVIIRDGKLLLEKRQSGVRYAGLWGCPGGKAEPGEMPRDAIVREIREELGVEACTGLFVCSLDLEPPAAECSTRCIFFRTYIDEDPRALTAAELRWVTADELRSIAREPAGLTPANEMALQSLLYLLDERAEWPDLVHRLDE